MRRLLALAAFVSFAAHAAPKVVYQQPEFPALDRQAVQELYRRCPALSQSALFVDHVEVWEQFALPDTPPWRRGWPMFLKINVIIPGGNDADFWLGAGPHPGIETVTPSAFQLCGGHFLPDSRLSFLSGLKLPSQSKSLITTIPTN